MISAAEWQWFGEAGHFICGRDCRFHLCTLVGDILVSTVGKYLPDSQVREVLAKSRGIRLEGEGDHREDDFLRKQGYEEIGHNRKFETMAFKAGDRCDVKGCNCGLPQIDGSELDADCYNDSGAATRGHYKMCLKAANGDFANA